MNKHIEYTWKPTKPNPKILHQFSKKNLFKENRGADTNPRSRIRTAPLEPPFKGVRDIENYGQTRCTMVAYEMNFAGPEQFDPVRWRERQRVTGGVLESDGEGERVAGTLYDWKQITRSLLARKNVPYVYARSTNSRGGSQWFGWIPCVRSTKCCYIPANSPANPLGSRDPFPFTRTLRPLLFRGLILRSTPDCAHPVPWPGPDDSVSFDCR